MTDKELLELAAKAYWAEELDDVCSIRWSEEDGAIAYTHGENQDYNGKDREFVWNPLTDDGDALRLANDCKIGIQFGTCQDDAPVVWCITEYGYKERSANFPDPYAATRRAIVRAAAEIGKELP